MPERHYEWQRFWVKRGEPVDLSDQGYLRDPESANQAFQSTNLLSTDQIAHMPCLVLLGEPGIGKSHAVAALRDIATRSIAGNNKVLFFDLHSFSSENRLVDRIFRNVEVENWRHAQYHIHFVLDSLDECLLHIATVTHVLADELADFPAERFSLCIACRTADWPSSLEGKLIEKWGEDKVGIYEMAPLRRVDIASAAEAEDLNSTQFLEEVDTKQVIPFAIKPVTLHLLLNLYAGSGSLPSNQMDIYRQGCLLLCEENNRSRLDSHARGSLDTEQRLEIASRIAAITTFCKRSAVWKSSSSGNTESEDITIAEICGGTETSRDIEIPITESAVHEALSTGLFTSRGLHRMGWAHQSYAEFLAARYLISHRIGWEQQLSLLTHDSDLGPYVIPQLRETAAWMAAMNEDLFDYLASHQIDILIDGMAMFVAAQKPVLVERLLALISTQQFVRRATGYGRYQKLSHATLAEQLRPCIVDGSLRTDARVIAIDIAEACELVELRPEVLRILTNAVEPLSLRVNAAWALYRFGVEGSVTELKCLLRTGMDNDPSDEIHGCILRALWPGHLSVEELFEYLEPSKDPRLFGAYWLFLHHDLVPGLQESDLPAALEWIRERFPVEDPEYAFRGLADQIIYRAWHALGDPTVHAEFCSLAISRLRHNRDIIEGGLHADFASELCAETEKRRQLVDAVAKQLLNEPEHHAYMLADLLFTDDTAWLIEKCRAAQSEDEKSFWADGLRYTVNLQDQGCMETLYHALAQEPFLAERYGHLLVTTLGSEQAEHAREWYLAKQGRSRQREDADSRDADITAVLALLADLPGDAPNTWPQLCTHLLRSYPDYRMGLIRHSLVASPIWQSLDEQQRRQVVTLARAYVSGHCPTSYDWIGTNRFTYESLYGCAAFQLLLEEDLDYLDDLSETACEYWAPALVACPGYQQADTDRARLVALVYRKAPDKVIQAFLQVIDANNRAGGGIYQMSMVSMCWDQRLGRSLLAKAKDTTLTPLSRRTILVELLKQGVEGAKTLTESMIQHVSNEADLDQNIAASLALIESNQVVWWDSVWPRIQEDQEFGRKLIAQLATTYDLPGHNSALDTLAEEQLGTFFEWVEAEFPSQEDPHPEGFHTVSDREHIASFRDSILRELESRGTMQAVTELRRLCARLPDLAYLHRALANARAIAVRTTWSPPQPRELLTLARHAETRFINSGWDLLNLLIESLQRLQVRLQGETPAVVDLWNEPRNSKPTPKDENRLSDYIKRQLNLDIRDRGIVINREVEIRRGTTEHPGERTDIYVSAISQTNQGISEIITVIIETKACWHAELKTAMKSQLVERYLRDNECQHGLYLVGWFICDEWDDIDSRKRAAARWSIDAARDFLSEQAKELSDAGLDVRSFVMNLAMR